MIKIFLMEPEMSAADFSDSKAAPVTLPESEAPSRRRRGDRLPDAAILVVEDEYWIAQDLARQISRDGSTVVGPAATPAKALALLATTPDIGGAILDVRLGAETAFAIAETLSDREIPFVFFTGYDDISWPPRFRGTPKISKTADWRDLKGILFAPRERRKRQARSFREDVAAALPLLRETARTLTGNATAGDRLVERVLETAIARIEERSRHESVKAWLMSVLRAESTKPDRQAVN